MTPTATASPGLRSVADAFRSQVEKGRDHPFLIFEDVTWTYGHVGRQARALAVGLRNLGIEGGDRVAVILPNWPEFVVSALAASELGATIVPLNPGYTPRELSYMLRNSEASVAITAEQLEGTDYLQLFETLMPELPDLQYLVTVGEEDLWYDDRIFQYEDLVASGRGRELTPAGVDPEAHPFAILYTPGTTGTPKGVVLSDANLVRTAGATAEALGLRPDDITLCAVPLYHIFGLSAALMTAMLSGSAIVLQERFDAAGALGLVERQGVTILHGVPTMFVMLLRSPELARRDLSTLRSGIIAGSAVTPELARDVRERLAPDVEIAYGLTETSPTVSITQPQDPPAAREQTVGRPLPGIEIRVVGEDGDPLPPESVGELVVRGYNVLQGYFRQPSLTAAAMTPDGFFRTGDLAMVDEEGYLLIVGRASDVIIRGGYNVEPKEIEDLLNSHPAVSDAAVLGVPNDVLGELVCACVVPVEGAIITAEELRDYCSESVADYKVPDLIRFVGEFPVAPSERALRVELARIVGAEGASPSDEPA